MFLVANFCIIEIQLKYILMYQTTLCYSNVMDHHPLQEASKIIGYSQLSKRAVNQNI